MSKKPVKIRTQKNPDYNVADSISNSVWAYLIILFISILCFSTKILDTTLLPRFLFLSVGFILIFILIYKDLEKEVLLPLNLFQVSLLSYFLINLISSLWARNVSEALFESEKIFLALNVFFFSQFFIKTESRFEDLISKLMAVIVLLASAFALFQIVNLKNLRLSAFIRLYP